MAEADGQIVGAGRLTPSQARTSPGSGAGPPSKSGEAKVSTGRLLRHGPGQRWQPGRPSSTATPPSTHVPSSSGLDCQGVDDDPVPVASVRCKLTNLPRPGRQCCGQERARSGAHARGLHRSLGRLWLGPYSPREAWSGSHRTGGHGGSPAGKPPECRLMCGSRKSFS